MQSSVIILVKRSGDKIVNHSFDASYDYSLNDVHSKEYKTIQSESNSFDNNHNTMDNTATTDEDNIMGSASDYILIAMIVAMMLCMAVCCLCLFCRSSSHFTVCGFNFEVNDRTTSVAIDDLSELHEVVPLTPTTAGTYNIPDIENKLQSDPPPPQYSDVAGPTMLERLKWKSKRRGASATDDKSNVESGASKSGEVLSRSKSRKLEKRARSRASHLSFQRSVSCQHPRVTGLKGNASTLPPVTVEDKPSKKHGFHSLKPQSSLQHSVSDCTFNARPNQFGQQESLVDHGDGTDVTLTIDTKLQPMLQISVTDNKDDIVTECSTCYKDQNSEQYDDEVFM